MLESLLAYHCGPALAGIKPANIAACHKSRIPNLHNRIMELNKELNKTNIYIEILCECNVSALVIVYRRNVLEKHLQNREVKKFLTDYGYPENMQTKEYLNFLRNRFKGNGFPHEVGVFLGYPLHDIYGFINHRDDGCLLTGDWKVYKDAENAKKMFLRYKACKKAILKRVTNGATLAQIFCAA